MEARRVSVCHFYMDESIHCILTHHVHIDCIVMIRTLILGRIDVSAILSSPAGRPTMSTDNGDGINAQEAEQDKDKEKSNRGSWWQPAIFST